MSRFDAGDDLGELVVALAELDAQRLKLRGRFAVHEDEVRFAVELQRLVGHDHSFVLADQDARVPNVCGRSRPCGLATSARTATVCVFSSTLGADPGDFGRRSVLVGSIEMKCDFLADLQLADILSVSDSMIHSRLKSARTNLRRWSG